MELLDIVHRNRLPEPWQEGDNIPWHEPAFSERMLREHLSEAHDAASRRPALIDAHIAWIQAEILDARRGLRILDLGCGPGLYCARLAALGHSCQGIDYSPASVAYARQVASERGLDCAYTQGDLREADYGRDMDLVMQIYGEINVFAPDDAQKILLKAHDALRPGGALLLEVHREEAVRRSFGGGREWSTFSSGLFAPGPHLLLVEGSWDADLRCGTKRYYVIEAATGHVTRHAQTVQAYTMGEYRALLLTCGFDRIAIDPAPAPEGIDVNPDFVMLSARRQ